MKKKKLAFGVLLLLILSPVFAIGTGEAIPSESEKKSLTMWFWEAAIPYQDTLRKVLADWYNSSQDTFELSIEFKDTVDKDIPVALATGSGPDIVYASGPSYTSGYVGENLVKNLDEYATQYGWKNRVLSVMYNACTVEGSLYSIPGGMCIGGLYYNKALFAEKGWEPPATWDAMLTLFEKAKAEGLYPLGAGNKGWKPCNEHFGSMIINHYDDRWLFYDALVGAIPFDDPRIVAAVEESKRWYRAGYLSGDDYVNFDSQNVMQLLADKRCAMVMAPSLYTQFAAQSFLGNDTKDVGFVAMPSRTTDQDVYDVSLNCNFSINAASPYPDECARILDYMLSDEFAIAMTRGWPGYWTVPITDLVDYVGDDLTGLSAMSIESFQKAIGQIVKGYFAYHPSTFFPNDTATAFRDIDRVWDGVVDAGVFCRIVDIELENEIADGLVCPLVDPRI